jgi:peptidoglycan/LPS O-acetylase OafA/YrhL
MTQRTRKLAGTIALLIFVVCYALLAMAVAMVLQVNNAGKAAELVYYVIAGLLWVLPAALLISWMQKPDS